MVRQRIFRMADKRGLEQPRYPCSDHMFKMIADRLPHDPDLSSQPTLSRFENSVSIRNLWRLWDVLADKFIQSFDTAPGPITLDFDAPRLDVRALTPLRHSRHKLENLLPSGLSFVLKNQNSLMKPEHSVSISCGLGAFADWLLRGLGAGLHSRCSCEQ